MATIEQVQALVSKPSDALAKQLLVHDEQLLAHDRALAGSELDAADALLQTKLQALRLPQLPASASLGARPGYLPALSGGLPEARARASTARRR